MRWIIMAGKGKNVGTFLLLFLSGIVLGNFIGMLPESFSGLEWLGYGQTFGTSQPIMLDLGIMVIQFGFSINLKISSIIGMAIAIFIYRFL